ncbi:hypothetical protein [Clostridium botulinum]|uniref:hypothetical protein n=2 Tax=Clostridium botulinum TaxID=1491 RepID=UPI001FB00519|nr:hypothetical protein [Clostridium botulinum]
MFEYLNDKYGDDKKLNEEVLKMTKTLYDSEVEKRGIEKGEEIKAKKSAENLLKLGVSKEIVAQGVGLTIEEVREIKKSLLH